MFAAIETNKVCAVTSEIGCLSVVLACHATSKVGRHRSMLEAMWTSRTFSTKKQVFLVQMLHFVYFDE